jgi:ABC-type uncharacterized transport system substrate-binding protein
LKKNLKYLFTGILVLIIIAVFQPGVVFSEKNLVTQNNTNQRTISIKKWRVGYCESEPFTNYAGTLYSLLKGLNELGWLGKVDGIGYQPGQQDTAGMWRWLSSRKLSPRIEFVGDAYFSLASLKEKEYQKIRERLHREKIDFVLVMGTSAGQLLANNRYQTPVMVFSASNAIQSRIIKSVTDSGRDNVWAHMDPKRFQRQMEVFYDTFQFHKLGLVYENSPTAYGYSAIAQIEAAAHQKGFAINRIYVAEPKNDNDQERYYADLSQAYCQLSGWADAMYLTVASIDKRRLPQLLTPFYAQKIPVFSQLGADEVKYGALMSVSTVDFKNLGRFGAENMVRFFSGSALRSLQQVFASTPKIIVNLEAARKTGYRFPFEALLAADQVFPKMGEH